MIDIFSIKLTQFEKTGSIGKGLVPLGNLKINSTISKPQVIHDFPRHFEFEERNITLF